MEKLTGKQNYILQILKQLIAENGYPPTVREIGEKAKLSSPATIHFHLSKLEEKGYIKKGDSKNFDFSFTLKKGGLQVIMSK